MEELRALPIGQLAADGCLVVVWMTNSQSLQHTVKEQLFPLWRVTLVAQWLWLKVKAVAAS